MTGGPLIDEDTAGFVAAFTEAMRPAQGQERHGRRMFVIAAWAGLAVVLGCLLNGALGQNHASAAPAPAGSLLPPATVNAGTGVGPLAAPAWTAVVGPSCGSAQSGFAESGYAAATPGSPAAGWVTSAAGGDTGDGCSGGFVSIPMSGQDAAYDADRYALWTFSPGTAFAHAACRLSAYVPTGAVPGYVGGNPAHYLYYQGPYSAAAAPAGGFSVQQTSKQGGWTDAAAFTATTGQVTVKLVDAGATPVSATAGARDAAAQMRLTCTAA